MSSSIGGVIFYKILRQLQFKEGKAAFLSLSTYLGTMILPYSTTLFSHQISSNIIIFTLYFLLKSRKYKSANWKFILLNSFLPFFEFTLAPISIVFFMYYYIRNKKKVSDYFVYIPILVVPLICLLLHNYFSYGDAISLGYGKLDGSPFSTGMSQGTFGLTSPSLLVLLFLFVSFYRGFFIFNIFCLISLKKIKSIRFYDKSFSIALLLVCTIPILINASYYYWQGGNCFGPRHLVPIIPIMVILFAKNYDHQSKYYWIFFIISYSINMMGTSVDVYLPERILNPNVFNFERLYNGVVALNRNDFLTNFYEGNGHPSETLGLSGASNLGLIIGLKGLWSILPLVTFHLFSFNILRRLTGLKNNSNLI
jgi:hypothetical protein